MTATRIDVGRQLAEVRRSVDARPGAHGVRSLITLSQDFAAEAADVWRAVTTPEELRSWFGPVTGELRQGARYEVEGDTTGTIMSCAPSRGFAATWEYGGDTSTLRVTLGEVVTANAPSLATDEEPGDGDSPVSGATPARGRTRVTLQHDSVSLLDFWRRYGPGATGVGWDLSLLGLAHHLATGASAPMDSHAWGSSPAGIGFIASCSVAWADAAVAAGVPHDEATAAQNRTTAFYLGRDEEA